MARFTLTAQVDHFSSVPDEDNTFYFTPATLQANDTIAGLASGPFLDTAVITEAGTVTAAQFAGVSDLERLILSAAGNSVTLSDSLVANSAPGYFTVSERVSVALPWRDSDGTLYVWQVRDGQVHATSAYSAEQLTPVAWHIESTADLNGDGQGDILWRHDDGTVGIWLMDNGRPQQQVTLAQSLAPTDWHIAATADFNGDRKADILWRNDDGSVGIWFMDGTPQQSVVAFGGELAPVSWTVVATGDFNGDGKADILWRHDDGSVGVWFMDGGQRQASVAFASELTPLSWHVEGAADFNGDGKADILWRDDSGAVGIWFMDGANRQSHAFDASRSPTSWRILDTADFNGDGRDDILWQNDNGEFGIWLIDGTSILATAAYHVRAGFHFVEAADLNGDGKSDIAWTGDEGNALVWHMDGTVATQAGEGSPPGNDVIDATAVGAGRAIHAIVGNGDDTYLGGAGDDAVFVVSTQLDAQDEIVGGLGNDALVVTDGNAVVTAAQLQQVTGFESLTLQAGGSATLTDTLSAAATFVANGTGAADAFDGSAVTAYDIMFNGLGGADALLGGAGDDVFNIPDSAFAAIAGGAGLDRIALASAGQHFDLHANAAKITGIEVISLLGAPGALLTLTGADIAQINASGNSLYVLGGSDDELIPADTDWTLVSTSHTNAAVAPGVTFRHFEHTSGADLFADDRFNFTVAFGDYPVVV